MSSLANTKIAKAAKKLKITLEEATNMIAYHHELENFPSKKKSKNITLNMSLDSVRLIEKISKTLRISESAVVSYSIIKYLDSKKQGEQSGKRNKRPD